jgi:hypothetical protein
MVTRHPAIRDKSTKGEGIRSVSCGEQCVVYTCSVPYLATSNQLRPIRVLSGHVVFSLCHVIESCTEGTGHFVTVTPVQVQYSNQPEMGRSIACKISSSWTPYQMQLVAKSSMLQIPVFEVVLSLKTSRRQNFKFKYTLGAKTTILPVPWISVQGRIVQRTGGKETKKVEQLDPRRNEATWESLQCNPAELMWWHESLGNGNVTRQHLTMQQS